MSFPKQIVIALACIACLSAYPLFRYGSGDIILASVLGAFLMTANVLVGYAAVQHSIGKSTTTFFKYVFGGMGLRLFVLTGILILLVRFFGIDAVALVVSMGIFYIVFMTLEILFIQQQIDLKQQS